MSWFSLLYSIGEVLRFVSSMHRFFTVFAKDVFFSLSPAFFRVKELMINWCLPLLYTFSIFTFFIEDFSVIHC